MAQRRAEVRARLLHTIQLVRLPPLLSLLPTPLLAVGVLARLRNAEQEEAVVDCRRGEGAEGEVEAGVCERLLERAYPVSSVRGGRGDAPHVAGRGDGCWHRVGWSREVEWILLL